MKKIIPFLLFTIIIGSHLIAQNQPVPPNRKKPVTTECGSDEIHKKLMETDSVYRKKNEDFEKLMAAINNGKTINSHLPVYSIPVVFYIINPGDPIGTRANLTDQQIKGALKYINQKLRESPVKYNDSVGVILQLDMVSTGTNPSHNTGIMRHELTKEISYVKNGVALGKHKGITTEKLKALSKSETNKYYTVYLVNKINGQDCSNKNDSLIEGYSHFYSSLGSTTEEAFILGCSFSNINNNLLCSQLINSLSISYIINKNNSNTKCQSKMNYEIFYSNTCK